MNDVETAIASFRLIETGDEELAKRLIGPDFVNHEAEDDGQPERMVKGPVGFLATASWLREAFSDLRFDVRDTVSQNGKVVVVAEMSGRQTGEFQGIPPSGRTFRQRQFHLFHLREGRIASHVAQRDDLGLLLQLGWQPRTVQPETVVPH